MRKIIIICACVFAIAATTVCVSAASDYQALDVNMDGEINISDATTIQRWLAEYDSDELTRINDYEPIELNFIQALEREDVGECESYAIIDSSDITSELLENRVENDVLIVERVIGKVTEGHNGEIINAFDGRNKHINYKYVEGITDGTIVLTYFIYNPNNNNADDIVNRYDFILDRSFERGVL